MIFRTSCLRPLDSGPKSFHVHGLPRMFIHGLRPAATQFRIRLADKLKHQKACAQSDLVTGCHAVKSVCRIFRGLTSRKLSFH